jgi:hypothetical protein
VTLRRAAAEQHVTRNRSVVCGMRDNRFLRLAGETPPVSALQSLTVAGRELLRETAELPDGEQALLGVLAEYRYAVYAFVAVADKL